jgi:DNA mismatch repair protein MutS
MPPKSASKSHLSCYFDAVKENSQKYGEKTVVLMMTGTFYEIYALRDNVTEEITGCNGVPEIMKITHLNYSEKQSAEFTGKTIMQFGFRDYSIDKYLAIFNEAGWTVAVYEQYDVEGEKHMERKLDRIFSPGTSFFTSEQSITNNIMCIWMKRTAPNVRTAERCVFGMSSLDIYTGKCVVHEYDVQKYKHQTTSYDELERFYSVFRPNEVIFVYDGVTREHVDDIIKYLNVGVSTRRIQLDADDILSKNVRKCEKQVYREEIMKTYYDFVDYHEFCDSLMLNMYEFAFQSLCYLLAFTSEHNANLTKHVKQPVLFTDNKHVILANHSLQQLNIIRDGVSTRSGVLSSVANFITSKTATDMGSRELKSNLLNPTTDENFLNNEYNITNYIVERNKHDDTFSGLRTNVLSKTCDIEKIYRRLLLNDAVPSTIKTLYDDLARIADYSQRLSCADLDEYLQYKHDIGVDDACNALLKITNFIALNVRVAECISGSKRIEENIFVCGVNLELDAVNTAKLEAYAKLNGIKKELEKLIEAADTKAKTKTKSKKIADSDENDEDSGLIVIHQTEKLPLNLKLTARRAKLLEDSLKVSGNGLSINTSQFSFATASQSGKFIHHPIINQLALDIHSYEAKLVTLINEQFKQFVGQLTEMFVTEFETVINYVTALDLATTKAYIATKFNYCCPDIDSDADKAFIDAKELRHVLIEHLQTNEIYVPNDVYLGREKDGILLFGTNSVGKSSLIKSIGISLVMAQAGLFVPATDFKFKPYKMIMTRILGNDNIFKGLSTFIVEMTELKTILTMATKDSLVLGDEVCSGTESVSAISIFAAALMKLHSIQSTFIFATHFHEVVKLDSIKALDRMMLKHMKVAYNAETDALEYVRVMCDGVGDTNYGLEVCRSLNMPLDFLDVAYDVRKIVAPETKTLLDSDGSRYNSGKIKHKCEMCGEMADEVHHLQEQHTADSRGFIGTFNKNHKANLMSICEACHDKIHAVSINKKLVVKKTKTTKGEKLSA